MKKNLICAIMALVVLSINLDAKRVNIPLKHTKDTKKEFVRWASGSSYDLSTAHLIALNACEGQLAGALEVKTKNAIKTYSMTVGANSRSKMKLDDEKVTEALTTTISQAILRDVSEIEYKVDCKRGVYTYYLAVAMPKTVAASEAVDEVIHSNIDEATKGSILRDRENFEKTLKDEFEK